MSPVLPLPQRVEAGDVLRVLRGGVLRVDAAGHDLAAAADLIHGAWGLQLLPIADDPDVIVRSGLVAAPAPIGADPRPADRAGRPEAYRIRPEGGRLVLTADGPEAVFRGLMTVAASIAGGGVPALEVDDHPRFAWRGLSLDVVRRFFPVAEVERIIDLLALHKLNVLHLHLNDTQAWRFAVPGYPGLTPDSEHYTGADLDRLVAYAKDRHVTIVPEFDAPGHVSPTVGPDVGVAVADAPHPFLRYLEWDAPGVADFARAVLRELARRFDGAYLHIGGDEAFGDPHESYVSFVRAVADEARGLGRRVIGWQETVRAAALTGTDLVQLWIAERDRFDPDKARATMPEQYHPFIALAAPLFAESVHDPARIGEAGIPAIVSSSDPLYLDRRPAEPSRDPAQNAALQVVGFPGYDATPSTDVLRWDPFVQSDIRAALVEVAGIEAALWCETVRDLDDVALLLLPRLGLVAQRAWGSPDAEAGAVLAAARGSATAWTALGFGNFYRSTEVFDS